MMAPHESGGASLTVADGTATILIDRSSVRNAMLFRTWSALPALIARAECDDGVRVLVLRGAGGHFGAGNDIMELGKLRSDPDGAGAFGRAMADAIRAVENATKPVVAAIEGSCYGASVALALAADFRMAASNSQFAITPAKLGALYLQSDLHRLVAAIGQGQARRLILAAATVDAAEAAKIGLVEQVVPLAEFDEEIESLTRAIGHGSPFTIHHSKRILRFVGQSPAPAEDEQSLGWFVDALQGNDFAEGYEAFMTKRKPLFGVRTTSIEAQDG